MKRSYVALLLLLTAPYACSGGSTELHRLPTSAEAGAGNRAPAPWPGLDEVEALDTPGLVNGNVSGVTLDRDTGALWVVANIPGSLYRLVPSRPGFAVDDADGFGSGKLLRFPDGTGVADAESVTLAATLDDGLYVASEHDNAAASVSRLSILRYDVAQPGASLTASHEWNVTAALPAVGANLGIEALTWVADRDLTQHGFFDNVANAPYDPAAYPNHGVGLFFVGMEQTGRIYGFALDHESGAALLLLDLETPFTGVMGLEHDRDTGYLWFNCDDTCDNQTGVLGIDADGQFALLRRFTRPAELPNSNHEGIALGRESDCTGGLKPFYWVDDNARSGIALRRGTIPCGPFL